LALLGSDRRLLARMSIAALHNYRSRPTWSASTELTRNFLLEIVNRRLVSPEGQRQRKPLAIRRPRRRHSPDHCSAKAIHACTRSRSRSGGAGVAPFPRYPLDSCKRTAAMLRAMNRTVPRRCRRGAGYRKRSQIGGARARPPSQQ
jgi:hypothetical protein